MTKKKTQPKRHKLDPPGARSAMGTFACNRKLLDAALREAGRRGITRSALIRLAVIRELGRKVRP